MKSDMRSIQALLLLIIGISLIIWGNHTAFPPKPEPATEEEMTYTDLYTLIYSLDHPELEDFIDAFLDSQRVHGFIALAAGSFAILWAICIYGREQKISDTEARKLYKRFHHLRS